MDLKIFHAATELVTTRLGLKPELITDRVWHDLLHQRMAKCNLRTYQDYYNFLLQSSGEMQELVELIVTPETWFFRDRGIFDYLMLLAKQRKFLTPTIKILSLACSTGEEPYSIAMALLDAGLSKHAFSIDAVDISQIALQKAKAGLYRKNAFRGKDLSYRDRFFSKMPSGYLLKDEIKENVHFICANLLENNLPFIPHSYQIIFCRNLLIYMDVPAQDRILNLLKKYLTPDGVLTVGPAETQIAYLSGCIPIKFPSTYAFQIRAGASAIHMENIFPIPKIKAVAAPQLKAAAPKQQDLLAQAPFNLPAEDKKESLLQQAADAADGGDFDASRQFCVAYMNQFGASFDVYYLLGLVEQAVGMEDKAEEFFRKTVYLKPSHYEALVCLALICESKGDLNQAELFRKRAQKSI